MTTDARVRLVGVLGAVALLAGACGSDKAKQERGWLELEGCLQRGPLVRTETVLDRMQLLLRLERQLDSNAPGTFAAVCAPKAKNFQRSVGGDPVLEAAAAKLVAAMDREMSPATLVGEVAPAFAELRSVAANKGLPVDRSDQTLSVEDIPLFFSADLLAAPEVSTTKLGGRNYSRTVHSDTAVWVVPTWDEVCEATPEHLRCVPTSRDVSTKEFELLGAALPGAYGDQEVVEFWKRRLPGLDETCTGQVCVSIAVQADGSSLVARKKTVESTELQVLQLAPNGTVASITSWRYKDVSLVGAAAGSDMLVFGTNKEGVITHLVERNGNDYSLTPYGEVVTCLHAGDSRAVLFGKETAFRSGAASHSVAMEGYRSQGHVGCDRERTWMTAEPSSSLLIDEPGGVRVVKLPDAQQACFDGSHAYSLTFANGAFKVSVSDGAGNLLSQRTMFLTTNSFTAINGQSPADSYPAWLQCSTQGAFVLVEGESMDAGKAKVGALFLNGVDKAKWLPVER